MKNNKFNKDFSPYLDFVTKYKFVFIITIVVMLIFSIFLRKNKKIFLHFSEISQIESENKQVGSITKYLASVNDMTMKVFECRNFAIKNNLSVDKTFAAELEERILPSFRQYNYEICDYVTIVPAYSDSLLFIFQNINNIRTVSGKIYDDFSQTYDYVPTHYEKAVTKTRTATRTNSKGKSETYTETYTEMEYDYSIHRYFYNSTKGQSGYISLQGILPFTGIYFPQQILIASVINAENMYSIMDSHADKQDSINEQHLLTFAQNYKTNSLLVENFNYIVTNNKKLENMIPVWYQNKGTARTESFRTYSKYNTGPIEYQNCDHIKNLSGVVFNKSTDLINSIVLTKQYTNQLNDLIRQLVDYELNNKDGDSDLADQVLDKAVQIYELNFKDRIEYSSFDFSSLLLFLFIGFVLANLISISAFLYNKRKYKHYEF